MSARFHTKSSDRKRHFIKEWRIFRNLTQEQLGDRLEMSKANISRLENGKQDYNQSLLEALAGALACEPADLIVRNPTDSEAPWSIWETLRPAQRRRALKVIKALSEEDEDDEKVA